MVCVGEMSAPLASRPDIEGGGDASPNAPTVHYMVKETVYKCFMEGQFYHTLPYSVYGTFLLPPFMYF